MTLVPAEGPFTEEERTRLGAFAEQLTALQLRIVEEARRLEAPLLSRCEDADDPMRDCDIDAEVEYHLREDDPAWREDAGYLLTSRNYRLKGVSRGQNDALADRVNDNDASLAADPDPTQPQHPRGLFRDLYDHHYGPARPRLALRDILRIGHIWVDIKVRAHFAEEVK